MKTFTAIVHHGEPDEGGFWATCLEVPGANGQGETREECLANLKEAIQLLLDTGREEAFRLDPQAGAMLKSSGNSMVTPVLMNCLRRLIFLTASG